MPHLFRSVVSAQEDLTPGTEEGGFSARLSDKLTLAQAHPPSMLTPAAASWQQKHLGGEPWPGTRWIHLHAFRYSDGTATQIG